MSQTAQVIPLDTKTVVVATCDLNLDPTCQKTVTHDASQVMAWQFGLAQWVTVGKLDMCPPCLLALIKTAPAYSKKLAGK